MLSDTRQQHRGTPLALLFTDSRGRIVFVDNNFLEMMAYSEATSLVGSPLQKVAGVDSTIVTSLMQNVARSGYVHELPLDLRSENGTEVRVLCSSVATYNPEGEFIGADMTLYDAGDRSLEDDTAPVHGDVLLSRIQQIHAEAEARAQQKVEASAKAQQADQDDHASEESIYLQLYFTAQVNALQVLLARMGGPRIHATLEANLNKLAQQNHWPVKILGGQITVSEAGVPAEGYQKLLKTVIDYSTNVMGRAQVRDEMRMIDSHMADYTRNLADQAGLRAGI